MDIKKFCRELNKQQRKLIAQVERETGQKVPEEMKKAYTLEEAEEVLKLVATFPPNHFLFNDTEFKTAQELYKISAK